MYTYEETLTQIKQESFFHKQVREDMYGLEVTAYSNYDPYLFLDDYGDIVQIIGETSHDGKEGRVYSTKILQMKSGNMKNHRLDNDVTYNTIEHIRNLLKSKSPRYMGEIIGNNLNVCRYSNKPITAPQSSFIYATESGEILIEMSHTTIGSVNNANHSDLRDFDTYSQRLAYDCYGKM